MDSRTRHLLLGFGGGLSAAVLLPFFLPVVSAAARPALKVLLKQSWLAMDRMRTAAAHASEGFEDLLAEVRAEVEEEHATTREQMVAREAAASSAQAPVEAKTKAYS